MTRTCQCHSERFHTANGSGLSWRISIHEQWKELLLHTSSRMEKQGDTDPSPRPSLWMSQTCKHTVIDRSPDLWAQRKCGRSVQSVTSDGRSYANIEPRSGMLQRNASGARLRKAEYWSWAPNSSICFKNRKQAWRQSVQNARKQSILVSLFNEISFPNFKRNFESEHV